MCWNKTVVVTSIVARIIPEGIHPLHIHRRAEGPLVAAQGSIAPLSVSGELQRQPDTNDLYIANIRYRDKCMGDISPKYFHAIVGRDLLNRTSK